MKNIISIVAIVAAFSIGIISCKKGLFPDDINVDPSQLQNPLPSSLLPGTILASAYEYGGDVSRFTSIFMQQTTGAANQSFSANDYVVTGDDVDNIWYAGYYGGGILNNVDAMIKKADSLRQFHYSAVGKIIMAQGLGTVTDLWGDAPYTEAFKGLTNTQPHYDTQQQLYVTIHRLLREAIDSLGVDDGSPFQPGQDDLLYGGDLDKWVKFAHSLKAKFYLHFSKIDPVYYDSALAEAALGFTSNDDDAAVRFAGTTAANTQNPWYQFNTQRQDIEFTGYIFDTLAASGDPRLDVYQDDFSGNGKLYTSPNSPVYFMGYDEIQFIIAEANFQRGNTAAAATAYNTGVEANLQRTVGSTAYLPSVQKTAGDITLADIMQQKYYALFLNPEVWTDWRRTGFPALQAPTGSSLGAEIPRTLLYPSSEQRYNSNAPRNTSMLRRVFWDVQ